MRKLLVLFVFALLFLSTSCTTEIITPTSENSGKLILKVDKQNAPSNVVFVKAYLSRENFDPIVATLNLLSDSTADLLLNEVAVGRWHLKVDAENDSGLILYTGETEVEVFAGFTSQVYLTLQPTGAGVGSIYINVTWGVPGNFSWVDYQNNPILVSSGNYFDYYGISQPVVIYDQNVYKMWYYGDSGGGQTYILYAESNDGINWIPYSGNPVISPSNYGYWDSESVNPGAVIKENGIYKMYYGGWSNQNSVWSIGLATSADGKNWTKYPQPILTGTYGWEYQLVPSSIVKYNDTYYLYYTGRNLPEYQIGVAISNDGINFTRYINNPILSSSVAWEDNGVLDASVVLENNQFEMIFMNSSANGFGFATSTDGVNWDKSNNNPFFSKEETSNNWANIRIAYPNYIKILNEKRIYYSGSNSNNTGYKIGFVRKPR
jgi:predicted GH43/DUF377 family glycosyl hydrolase